MGLSGIEVRAFTFLELLSIVGHGASSTQDPRIFKTLSAVNISYLNSEWIRTTLYVRYCAAYCSTRQNDNEKSHFGFRIRRPAPAFIHL